MIHRPSLAITVLIAVAFVAAGCGGDAAPDRGGAVSSVADDVAIPAFTDVEASAAGLLAALGALCAAPSDDALESARIALADTRRAWWRSEAVAIGPVMANRSAALIDYPPVPAEIDELLADPGAEPLDATYLSRRVSAAQRGLGGIEYVLLSPGLLSASDLGRRCDYLDGTAQVVADEASRVLTQWTTDQGDGTPYRDVAAGATDAMTATETIDELVNDMLSNLEVAANRELGPAATGDSSAIVEGPGGFGARDQQARAAGMRLVLLGPDDAAGLSTLMGDELRTRLIAAFDEVDTALTAIDGPLVDATTADPDVVGAAAEAFAALRVLVSTEVVSALGVTVGFSDNDGDSAA